MTEMFRHRRSLTYRASMSLGRLCSWVVSAVMTSNKTLETKASNDSNIIFFLNSFANQ